MRVLFSGERHVDYGQIYVQSELGGMVELSENFTGQQNGLCGAVAPGSLFLITGLHTGNVGFTAEVYDSEPPVDNAWQEIVEASFRPASPRTVLVEWGGDVRDLNLPPLDYRVRYCASGMDEGRAAGTRMDGEPQLDRYLLQFWPSQPAPDRVVKQTSEIAAYWHGAVRTYPSPEQIAEARRRQHLIDARALLAAHEESERRILQREILLWSGRLPSDRLRAVGGNAQQLAGVDRDLVDAIADAEPSRQREIARVAVHWAYRGAGLTGIDWVAPALAALDRGADLPAPFNDQNGVWQYVFGDARVPSTIVPGTPNFSRQAAALPAIFQAIQEDPLQAAIDAVWTAAFSFGTDRDVVLDEIRDLLG